MQVLGTSLTQVGTAKMLPYLAMFATSNAGAWFGDALITQHGYSVASARKAVNSMGAPRQDLHALSRCASCCYTNTSHGHCIVSIQRPDSQEAACPCTGQRHTLAMSGVWPKICQALVGHLACCTDTGADGMANGLVVVLGMSLWMT